MKWLLTLISLAVMAGLVFLLAIQFEDKRTSHAVFPTVDSERFAEREANDELSRGCITELRPYLDQLASSNSSARKEAARKIREIRKNCQETRNEIEGASSPTGTSPDIIHHSVPTIQQMPRQAAQPQVERHGWYKLTDRNAWRIVFRPNAQNGIEYSLDLPELRNASRIRIYGREGHLETIKEPSLSVGPDGTGQNRCIVDENTGGTIPHTGISCGALLVNTGSGWQFAGEGFTLANTGGTLRVTANIHRSAPQDVKTISVFSFTVEPI